MQGAHDIRSSAEELERKVDAGHGYWSENLVPTGQKWPGAHSPAG